MRKSRINFSASGNVRPAIGLFLRPARAGDEQQWRVGTDRLRVGLRLADANHRGALAGIGQIHRHQFNRRRARAAVARRLAAGVNEHEPRTLRSRQRGLHALAIEPAVDRGLPAGIADAGHMGIHASAEPLRHTGQNAIPA